MTEPAASEAKKLGAVLLGILCWMIGFSLGGAVLGPCPLEPQAVEALVLDVQIFWFSGEPLDSPVIHLGVTDPCRDPIPMFLNCSLIDAPEQLRATLAHELLHAFGWLGHAGDGLMQATCSSVTKHWPPESVDPLVVAFLKATPVQLRLNWDVTRPELGEVIREVTLWLNLLAGRQLFQFALNPDTLPK